MLASEYHIHFVFQFFIVKENQGWLDLDGLILGVVTEVGVASASVIVF